MFTVVLWKKEKQIGVIKTADIIDEENDVNKKGKDGKRPKNGKRKKMGLYGDKYYPVKVLASSDSLTFLDTLEYDTEGEPWMPNNEETPRATKKPHSKSIAAQLAKEKQAKTFNQQLLQKPGLSSRSIPGVDSEFLTKQKPAQDALAVMSRSLCNQASVPSTNQSTEISVNRTIATTDDEMLHPTNPLVASKIVTKVDVHWNNNQSEICEAEKYVTPRSVHVKAATTTSKDLLLWETPLNHLNDNSNNAKRKIDFVHSVRDNADMDFDRIDTIEEDPSDEEDNTGQRKSLNSMTSKIDRVLVDSSNVPALHPKKLVADKGKLQDKKDNSAPTRSGVKQKENALNNNVGRHYKNSKFQSQESLISNIEDSYSANRFDTGTNKHKDGKQKLSSDPTLTDAEWLGCPDVQKRLASIFLNPTFKDGIFEVILDKLGIRSYAIGNKNITSEKLSVKRFSVSDSKSAEQVLLQFMTEDTLKYIISIFKHKPTEFALELLRTIFNEEDLATMSISGDGGEHVTQKIPDNILKAILAFVVKHNKYAQSAAMRHAITCLCNRLRGKFFPKNENEEAKKKARKSFKRKHQENEEDEEEGERSDTSE